MLIFEPWKKALIAFVCLLGLSSTLPNLFYSAVQPYNDALAVQLDPSADRGRASQRPQPRTSPITRAFNAFYGAVPGHPTRRAVAERLRGASDQGEVSIEDHWAAVDLFFAEGAAEPALEDPAAQAAALEAYRGLVRFQRLSAARSNWPSFLPSSLVNLGLDLQGGAHFLLEAQLEDAFAARMENLRSSVGPALREAGVRRYRARLAGDDALTVRIARAEDVENAGEVLSSLAEPVSTSVLGGFGEFTQNIDIALQEDGQTYRVTLTDAAKGAITNRTMAQAVEVVRRRVDELGTREPTIQRQGVDRILVQLPGYAGGIPTDTAKLTFQMVAADQSDEIRRREGVERLPYPEGDGEIEVLRRVDITGEQLADALQGFDQQTGQPVVNIRFDASGARIFGDITRANMGRRFAMVLDGEVLSAPVIRAYITDGNAQISGDFTVEEATMLSVNLRAGSLPVPLSVEESSVVGPELGADSIAAGQMAGIIGFALVLVYMGVSYGLFGLFANAALMLNVTLIFGALSMLGATLTLPGIAGIVLTIGMAVDANVLIFERIREELRRGRNVLRAIETGYERALSAIIDANVTTFLAALILFAMGSGPVKGFAVTLGIGIMTSVFTAVMLTRLFVALWFQATRPKALSL